MPLRTRRRGKDSTRTITALAAAVALAVTAAIPATYFAIAWTSHRAVLRTEAEINARLVNRLISANPEMWQYEELRLGDLLSRRSDANDPERRTVYDAGGTVVARRSDSLDSPVIAVSHVLRDSGRPVGRLEIVRSLRHVVFETAGAAAVGLTLGFAVFYTLRMLPMSALRSAVAALSQEKERVHATLQSIRDGVVMVGPDGDVVLLNSAAERITGCPLADATGRPFGEVVRVGGAAGAGRHEGDAPGRWAAAHAGYAVLVSRDGTERLVEDLTAPILGGDGRPAGSVHVVRDVTEKVRQDEELLKARKMESLGILAGGIAHDFNNLLTGVLGNISLAKLDASAGGRLYQRLDEAEKASGRARELASRLLSFSRGGLPVRKLIALPEILRDSAVLATSGTGVQCAFRIEEGLWPAEADAGQLTQVVNNLVMNAVQAMPGGGTVTVGAENVSLREEEIPGVAAGDYVRVSVADHGVGIPRDCLPRIFDPYFTTKPGGTGLGLTSCYNIVKSHGGSILAESEPGRTVFRVYLPASKAALLPDRPRESEAVVRGRGRILVMDDDDLVRSVADGMLGHLGYETAFASDGAQAVAMYARAADSGEPFSAVILDLTVHCGMGGKEAIGKLRDLDAGVRAIVSSGYSSDPVMADYRAYGFAGVVAKPYRIEELSRVLDDVVHRAPGADCSA